MSATAAQPQVSKHWPASIYRRPDGVIEQGLSPARLRRSPDLLARGAEMTMHSVIDQSVDQYFPLVGQLHSLLDGLEQKLFEEFDEGLIHEIFKAKRAASAVRRHVGPLRE